MARPLNQFEMAQQRAVQQVDADAGRSAMARPLNQYEIAQQRAVQQIDAGRSALDVERAAYRVGQQQKQIRILHALLYLLLHQCCRRKSVYFRKLRMISRRIRMKATMPCERTYRNYGQNSLAGEGQCRINSSRNNIYSWLINCKEEDSLVSR